VETVMQIAMTQLNGWWRS